MILTHFSEVPTIFSGMILPGIGRSIALEAVPSLELGLKATPMFTTWVLTRTMLAMLPLVLMIMTMHSLPITSTTFGAFVSVWF